MNVNMTQDEDRSSAERAINANLTDALACYLRVHIDEKQLCLDAKRNFDRFIALMGGDKQILDIRPKEIRLFVEHELARGLRTRSVRKALNYFSAATWMWMEENSINIWNPFHRVRIPKEGFDVKRHEPLSRNLLTQVQAWCVAKDDEIRWMLAMVTETGARAREIAGLALEDIHIDIPVPYVSISDHPWRRLKTKHSKREIPLVGVALWAATRVKEESEPGQVYAFPRYIKYGKTVDGLTTGINYWLMMRGLPIGVHGFRHVLVDRMREANFPLDIRRSILGWSPGGLEARYGYGYSREVLHSWMSKLPVTEFMNEATTIKVALRHHAPLYDCMCEVIATICTFEGSHTLQQMQAVAALSPADFIRGLREGKKRGLVSVIPQPSRPRASLHILTGMPLPAPPASLLSSTRTLVLYSMVRRLTRQDRWSQMADAPEATHKYSDAIMIPREERCRHSHCLA